MQIIRDEEMNGIMMIPLFQQYGLHRCNVKDCKNKHTTIIIGLADITFALCELHYNEAKANKKINCTLEF